MLNIMDVETLNTVILNGGYLRATLVALCCPRCSSYLSPFPVPTKISQRCALTSELGNLSREGFFRVDVAASDGYVTRTVRVKIAGRVGRSITRRLSLVDVLSGFYDRQE